jgi:DNA excision repair protein ERCC-3
MTSDSTDEKLERLQELADQAAVITQEIDTLRDDVDADFEAEKEDAAETVREHINMDDLQTEHLAAFAEEPYCILPKAENEAYIVVPRFVPFSVGWLDRQTDSYNVFVVNKYVDWIDSLPEDIRGQVGIEPQYKHAEVADGMLELSDEDERDRAWDDLGGRDGGLYQRKGDDKIKLKDDSEFDVIANLIDKGNLPFSPSPVEDADLRPEPESIDLRDYQQRAWEQFEETGMVGVYWPPGAGKTFLSLYAGERIDGKKLVVVPSSTLEEQWENRIQKFCRNTSEWEVRTYQYLTHGNNMQDYSGSSGPILTIFDENHRLPANTFSKLATINTKYRLGLSASPYREDGRTEYIFALTGYPVGLKWQELVALGAVETPDAEVYLYRTSRQKRNGVETVVNERTGKTIIFCDSLDEGKRLSEGLGVPFVHGETRDRMEKFRENRVVISSRVGDEGVSLPDLETVIEYDFHGSSRRQEAQRYGRVMHGDGQGEHIILMTDDEYEKYGSRLHSLEEQGINVRFQRRE